MGELLNKPRTSLFDGKVVMGKTPITSAEMNASVDWYRKKYPELSDLGPGKPQPKFPVGSRVVTLAAEKRGVVTDVNGEFRYVMLDDGMWKDSWYPLTHLKTEVPVDGKPVLVVGSRVVRKCAPPGAVQGRIECFNLSMDSCNIVWDGDSEASSVWYGIATLAPAPVEPAKEDRPSFPVGSRVKHSHAMGGPAGTVKREDKDARYVSWDDPKGENSCWVDVEYLMWESDK
jgi:hypothetical protein